MRHAVEIEVRKSPVRGGNPLAWKTENARDENLTVKIANEDRM